MVETLVIILMSFTAGFISATAWNVYLNEKEHERRMDELYKNALLDAIRGNRETRRHGDHRREI